MKTKRFFSALAIGAVAMVFASCSKDDDNDPVVPTQQEIEEKIIGKWKTVHRDGEDVLTNKRDIFSFSDKTNGCFSSSQSFPDHGNIWYNKFPYTYSISNNELLITIDSDIIKEIFGRITDINNECFNITMGDKSNNSLHTSKVIYNRMTADYTQDIIGMWEGVEMTGDETYGNAEARIEYHTDGTYTYFKKYADIWCPSENVDNEYNVDGDWLATRWRPEKGADYNYEWWDIDDVKNGTMNWSALREKENGERYTTTFTWKKVDTPTEEQYKVMILGEWEVVEGINYELKDGKLVDSTPASLGRYHVLYTFGHDDTFSMIRKDEDGTKLMEAYGHYELRGSVVSFIYERMFFMGEPLDVTELAYPVEINGISMIDEENLTLVEYMKFEDDPNECDHLLMYMKMQRQ